ncbi:MAG: hypothetical protein JOY55_02560 [Mycobacterium sp.]|nr:hypothetical protein [Mycobacterium sp.]
MPLGQVWSDRGNYAAKRADDHEGSRRHRHAELPAPNDGGAEDSVVQPTR